MPIHNLFNKLKAFIITEKAFFKNVSFVFGGKVYVAILSILLTPIIARLFTPEDYGEFGLYNAVTLNLVVIGTLSLPLASSTARKSDLNKIFNLTLTSILIFASIFFIFLYFFNYYFDSFFSTSIFSNYWILIVLGFISGALRSSLHATNIRLQKFKLISQISVIEGSASKAINLGGGWMGLNSIGLILSDVASKIISVFIFLKNLTGEIKFKLMGFDNFKKLLLRYKHFPSIVLPTQWVGMVNNQFIILAVAFFFSKDELGQVIMTIGLLSIPLHLVTNAFQPVITERLTALKNSIKNATSFISKTLIILSLIGTILYVPILLMPINTFTFFLGDKWVGIYPTISVFAIYYLFLILDQSFENGFIVFFKQKIFFLFSLVEFALQLLVIIYAYLQHLNFFDFIILMALVRTLVSITRVMYLCGKLKPTLIEL